MRFAVTVIVFTAMFLVNPFITQLKAEQAAIETITLQPEMRGIETVEFQLNGDHIPKIFKMGGDKPRLVLDFADTIYRGGKPAIPTTASLVTGIRTGQHFTPQPKIRVVIDLIQDTAITWNQDFEVHNNLLTVSIISGEVELEPLQEPVPPPVAQVPESVTETIESSPEPAVTADQEVDSGSIIEKDKVQTKGQQPAGPPVVIDTAPAQVDKQVKEVVPPDVAGPRLLNVSYERPNGRGEMVLFKLNDFYPPEVSAIEEGIPRIVCYFKDMQVDKGVKDLIEVGGEYVDRIRVTEESDAETVKVVLDLTPGRDYDLQQVFFKEEHLFVLIVNVMISDKQE